MTLSALELDVLAGAAHGETVKETADRLGRGLGTVKHHRAAIIDKLDVANMAAAVHRAHELGVLGRRVGDEALPIKGSQRDAFHAKCSDLDIARELDRRTTKKQMLAIASSRFGRLIESANDLTRAEARVLLDLLEQMLDSVDVEAGADQDSTAVGASA